MLSNYIIMFNIWFKGIEEKRILKRLKYFINTFWFLIKRVIQEIYNYNLLVILCWIKLILRFDFAKHSMNFEYSDKIVVWVAKLINLWIVSLCKINSNYIIVIQYNILSIFLF